MDWSLIIALAAVSLSALSLARSALSDSLSIREHNEYKDQERQKAEMRDRMWEAAVEDIKHRLTHLENSK